MASRTIAREGQGARPLFDKNAYNQFKLPMRFGEAISGWDDPEMIAAGRATHMRDDDYVVGLVFRDRARAYPLWVVDNYHVVNDRIDDERFYMVSCERCQSGAAFQATVGGNPEREPLFRSVGFMNATLLLKDLRSGSHWIHYNGTGLDRRASGIELPWIPTYHMEWADWLDLHPNTEVMLAPDDPRHPDARHGHGREEIFARAGMDPTFIPTILGPLDETYPENEMILGLRVDEGDETEWAAYPLTQVHREGGVVQEILGGRRIAVFAGPRADGFTMSSFEASSATGRELTFQRSDGRFHDRETGSVWSIEGRAIDGPLEGETLAPLRWSYVRWHAWIYFHPQTLLFRSDVEPPRFGSETAGSTFEAFDPVLSLLSAAGHDVRIGGPLVSQRRPRQSRSSLRVYLDGDPLFLHAFESDKAARDFHEFDASWSGLPIKPRSHEGRTRRIGTVVIESDPEDRYVDRASIIPLPPTAIRWAPILDSPLLDDLVEDRGTATEPTKAFGFLDVVRALRMSGLEIIDIGFLPPGQLRVGCVNAIALTIDSERFLLYRFETAEQAAVYAAEADHARAEGPFVLRSTPDTMYEHQGAEILFVNDDTVRWSRLLDDLRLRRALQQAIGVTEGEASTDETTSSGKGG